MKNSEYRKKNKKPLPSFNGDYDKCKTPHERYQLMANKASGGKKCWWIYTYVMASASYRGWK